MSILPDSESFRKLVDGTRTGSGPAAARCLLAIMAIPYAIAVTARNALYDWGMLPTKKVPVPVIAVGNLTVGGTGKTPLVAWICRRLVHMGRRPAIVSRGYGARAGETSDEAAELALLLPGVPHVANRDRVAGALEAVARGADVVVLDDGFQHRRLARDLDIVAIDASDPFGCQHVLPRGLLRESVRGLARADAIVLTRATSIDERGRRIIRDMVMQARHEVTLGSWTETEHCPVALRSWNGTIEEVDRLRGQPIAAFCGIGNPAAFRKTIEDLGVDLVGFNTFADHHAYSARDLAALATWAGEKGAIMVLTTLKDLVRIRMDRLQDVPLKALEVSLAALGPVDALDQLLRETMHTGAPAQ